MQIKVQPMETYQTNCYIVTIDGKDLIIDPGQNATQWVIQNATNPIAILNTHGHFDHIWSNAELKQHFDIPIYCQDADAFMLESDPFEQGTPVSHPDYRVVGDEDIDIDNIQIKYRHFPGHSPGCSIIEIDNHWFSGDFLFQNSIGRWDFPYSSAKDMLGSLKKAMDIQEDFILHPGHGGDSTLANEQRIMPYWIEEVQRSI